MQMARHLVVPERLLGCKHLTNRLIEKQRWLRTRVCARHKSVGEQRHRLLSWLRAQARMVIAISPAYH
jgi:hypothetical protein